MIERLFFAALTVVAVVIGACVSGCEPPAPTLGDGLWSEVRPWPGAPQGTRCWVYSYGVDQFAIGGPECIVPGGAQ